MPGIRDRNLRSGDLHEELGIFLLKALALVAPVPRQEDVGNDAFATLVRPEGSRRLIPDLSFLVQLKAASISTISYKTPDEVAWIRDLESPLFIGRVDLKQARIELFSTLRLHQILLEYAYQEIELLLDPAEELLVERITRRVNIGPPVHTWSMAEITEPDFIARSYAVLHPHVDTLRSNRILRGIQFQRLLTWDTGQPPKLHSEMTLSSSQHDIVDTLRNMTPYCQRIMTELRVRSSYADLVAMSDFCNLMRRWGVDPDPVGMFQLICGGITDGRGLSLQEAIYVRQCVQPKGELNLWGLRISDQDLALVDQSVTKLDIRDSAITDDGVKYLLSFAHLRRLIIAGTQITDEGLAVLANLKSLEWICVTRTRVTAIGVEHLIDDRPDITVLIDSEP